jgi:uroporphyrinogen-III synthase
VQRLFEVAAASQREKALATALQAIRIGAVGPIVAEELRRRGVEATITPDHGYFMKPLVSAFLAAFSR